MKARGDDASGDILVTGIGELATPLGSSARRGAEMREVSRIRDAAIAARGGIVEYAGPRELLPEALAAGLERFDAGGAAVAPGFVDSHAHFVFAGWRPDEFLMRASGASYMDIHRSGGGILRSVRATRAASLEELAALGEARARAMLAQGVTTVESKSGYGLDLETELRQLEASALVAERVGLGVVPTYLGLHATPPEFASSPSRYVDYAIAEVLPAVAARGAARFCDAFCEEGVFGLADCRRFLEAARARGLGLKLHAEEIERTGGAVLAAELGAASADHLLVSTEADWRLMASAGVVATCLPLTSFCLRKPHANARGMIDSGLAVALATDLNPGSACSGSVPLALALAVLYMGLGVEEALTAFTLNGAAALGLAGEIGSIEAGKRADFVVLDAPSIDHLPYRTGANLAAATFKGGRLAWRA